MKKNKFNIKNIEIIKNSIFGGFIKFKINSLLSRNGHKWKNNILLIIKILFEKFKLRPNGDSASKPGVFADKKLTSKIKI